MTSSEKCWCQQKKFIYFENTHEGVYNYKVLSFLQLEIKKGEEWLLYFLKIQSPFGPCLQNGLEFLNQTLIFKPNFDNAIKASIETFWHSYT